MAKTPPNEDTSMSGASETCNACRRREQIAKKNKKNKKKKNKKKKKKKKKTKKALPHHRVNHTNPAPQASAPTPAPRPQISKPQIAKPVITFGLKVLDLIIRDTMQLQAPKYPDGDRNGLAKHEKMSKLVLFQAGIPQRQLHALNETPAVKKPRMQIKTKGPMIPTEYNVSSTFKFTKLPAELRIMIEQSVFIESSGKKPKLFWR
ncbi:hypothetical protein ONS95_000929 [Cadophora gregata]|uniref:uncharacterized protein n=1 Tax=Cadophora gregata TaxID=51156 RepID=UPI0026DD0329|nr:uncharacterized protein ONS95_000929 [Cadophora gregata]KAK0128987.1 hypothetical protein ONS95_000929 [Cadophora gregata]